MPAEIPLEGLRGRYTLTGVDLVVLPPTERDDWYDSSSHAIRFILDGLTYEAKEDPQDDYRSSLDTITIVTTPVNNVFEPCQVIATKRAGSKHEACDIVDFTDTLTGKVVLSVGTDNTDDYYPWFVGDFDPTALFVNRGVN